MYDIQQQIKELVITRCIAHQTYLSNRILKDSKRVEFEDAMIQIIDYLISDNGKLEDIYNEKDKHGGIKMAAELYDEISYTTWKRFSIHRSGDFYLEKI